MPKGGLREYSDRLEFEAPESGYQPEILYRHDVADPNYVGQLKKLFFLKLRNGTAYARIDVELIGMWNDSSAVFMKSWVNPRGSRNLEFDPKLQLLPPRW